MSLHDIFMQRAALEHQNALASDTTGIILQALGEGVAKGISEEQQRVQKQRDEERTNTKRIESFNKIMSMKDKEGKIGTKIKASIDKEGNPSFSLTDVDEEEEKFRSESLRLRQENLNQKIEEEKRRGLTQKMNNLKSIGGVIPTDEMKTLNEEVGFDLGTDLSSGRVEQTPEGNFRILSSDEFAKKSAIMKEQADAESSLNTIGTNIKQIYNLFDKVTPNLKGPIEGRVKAPVQGFLGNKGVRLYEDMKNAFLSNISRQVAGEKGVLTDQDIDRVRGLLPRLEDTDEIKEAKFKEMQTLLDTRRNEINRRTNTSVGKVRIESNKVGNNDHSNLWK